MCHLAGTFPFAPLQTSIDQQKIITRHMRGLCRLFVLRRCELGSGSQTGLMPVVLLWYAAEFDEEVHLFLSRLLPCHKKARGIPSAH
jgi:hypothetical protein